jgi:lipopolysaccharide export system permease protein
VALRAQQPPPPQGQQQAAQQKPESAAARPVAPSAGDQILRELPPNQAGVPGPKVDRIQLQAAEESARAREQVMKYQRIRYDIEIQKKFSLAAACIIFVLLGPPIALRFPRGGVGLVIGVSFAVFALYYVGLIGGEPLANSQFISPFWAMWSDNLLMFIVGVAMSLRMNRVGGTARGGDWSEVRDMVLNFARRLTGRPRRTA